MTDLFVLPVGLSFPVGQGSLVTLPGTSGAGFLLGTQPSCTWVIFVIRASFKGPVLVVLSTGCVLVPPGELLKFPNAGYTHIIRSESLGIGPRDLYSFCKASRVNASVLS